jgi:multidrug transporter EmrE-like cation transporter
MNGAVIALVATGLYYVGTAVFKVSASRMPPLHGTRPIHLFGRMFTSWIWLIGLVIVAVGFVLQFNALAMLPLSVAQPIFVSTLVILLWIAVGILGERLTAREWLGLTLFAVATLMLAMSVVPGQGTESTAVPATGLFLAVALPSLVIPVIVFSIGDLRPAGRHARPLSGVAYGLSSGVLVGTCELAVKGTVNLYHSGVHDAVALLTEPYVYVIAAGAILGICQAQIALQRCRLAIVLSVCTVAAKTQLVVMGTMLYGEPWPHDPLWSSLRVAGFALGIATIALFPRYEAPEHQVEGEDVADLVKQQQPKHAREAL